MKQIAISDFFFKKLKKVFDFPKKPEEIRSLHILKSNQKNKNQIFLPVSWYQLFSKILVSLKLKLTKIVRNYWYVSFRDQHIEGMKKKRK